MSFRRLWQQWFGKTRKQGTRRERQSWRSVRFEPLEQRQLLTVNFTPVLTTFTTPASKDLLIPLTSVDSAGGAVSYSVSNNTNAANVLTSFVNGGTTIVFNVSGKDGSNVDFTGDITVRLFDDLTPNTVGRIRELISQHFYNGLTFHRILALGGGTNARIAQGGDPAGNGGGGPGTQIDDEFNTNSTFNSPGLLAMAKSNDDTNGSQFFFVNADPGLANSPQHLNFNHTILGQVVAGFSTLNKVMNTPANSNTGVPNSTMRINYVREATDNQNGILRVDPGATFTGTTSITVIATGSGGQTSSQTFNITVQADSANDTPILNSFPAPFQQNVISTPANTPITFALSATDMENDALTFKIVDPATFSTPSNVQVQITGNQITLTPTNGFTGTIRLRVEVSDRTVTAPFTQGRDGLLDAQEFTLVVGTVPTVSVGYDQATVAENGGPVHLIATLSAPSTQSVTVTLGYGGTAILNAGNFTANAQRDYNAALTITIPAGQTTASIPVSIVDDSLNEANETAVVHILTASGASAATTSATLTITDNDTPPTVSLSVSPNSLAENAGTSTVTATLAAPSGRDVTITLGFAGTATNNTDYSASTNQIVIPAGQTSGTITLRGIDDTINDDNESIIVTVANAPNVTIGAQSAATATILDDDLGVSLSVSANQIGENGGTSTVTVTLDQTNSTAVTVQLLTSGTASSSDFQLSTTSLTIPVGATTASATLSAVNDQISEPTETVIFRLGTPSAGSINTAASTATVSILDNDQGVSISSSATSFGENGGTATVIATLSQTNVNPVTINFGFTGLATNNTDYSASTATITIPAGQLTGSFDVTGIDDAIVEGPENLIVTILSADNNYSPTQGSSTTSLTINDDETPPQISISSSGTTLAESASSTSITIFARSNITSVNDIIVPLTFTGSATLNSDYSASSASIVIPAGQTSGSVVVSVINDTLVEADETVVLGIGSITNGTQSGSFASTISIISDDLPKASMSVSSTKFAENGGATTVSATLDQVAVQTVTIPLNIASGTAILGTDFSASTNTITIAAGQSTGSVVISGIDDNLFESDETFTVSVSSSTVSGATLSGSFSQTVTITSEDISLEAPKLAAGSDDGVSITDNYTGDSTPSFTISASSGQSVKFKVNGTEVGSATDNHDNTYSFTVPDGKLKIGENTIAVDSGTTSSTMSITYAPKLDEGYRVGGNVGGTTNVSFSFNAQNARFRSEVGVYIADDATGRIGNIRPGDEGYAKAALTNASILFTRGVAVGANQVISLKGGQVLGFYLVQNGTSFQATRLNPTNRGAGAIGLGGPVTFFSFDAANPDGVRHVQVVGDPLSGHAEYRWEDLFGGGDMDFNDFVFSVNLAGSGVQPTMETLRVPVASTATASTTFTLRAGQQSPTTPTSFTNVGGEFGIFKITNSSGTVNNLTPGSAGWLAAALASANRTSIFGASEINGAVKSLNLSGSDQFGFYRIKGGTADQFLQQNPNNNSTGSIYALVSFDPANPDDQDHFRWFGPENVNQGITGQGAADDDIRLHIMDKLFGDESSFDDFTVSIRF